MKVAQLVLSVYMYQNSRAPEIWCKERETAVHDNSVHDNSAGTLKEKIVEATKSWRWEEICKITSLSACIFSLHSTSASGHQQWRAWGRGSFGPTQNGFCHCSVHEGHQHMWLLIYSCSTSRRKWEMLRMWTKQTFFPCRFPMNIGPAQHNMINAPTQISSSLTGDFCTCYRTKRRAPGLLETASTEGKGLRQNLQGP